MQKNDGCAVANDDLEPAIRERSATAERLKTRAYGFQGMTEVA
jgi:hypothetical protein